MLSWDKNDSNRSQEKKGWTGAGGLRHPVYHIYISNCVSCIHQIVLIMVFQVCFIKSSKRYLKYLLSKLLKYRSCNVCSGQVNGVFPLKYLESTVLATKNHKKQRKKNDILAEKRILSLTELMLQIVAGKSVEICISCNIYNYRKPCDAVTFYNF